MKTSAPDADVRPVPPSHQRLNLKTRSVVGAARALSIAFKLRTVFLWLCKNGANEPPPPFHPSFRLHARASPPARFFLGKSTVLEIQRRR